MYLKHIFIVFFSSVLASCASASSAPDEQVRDLDLRGSDCIWIRTIRDYTALDSRSLLIYGSGKRAYFVRLAHPTMDLKSSFRVGFRSRDDQLCPYGGDELVFDGSFAGETARILAISRISDEQAEQLLVRFGKTESDRQNVPAPQEVSGAEIEELD